MAFGRMWKRRRRSKSLVARANFRQGELVPNWRVRRKTSFDETPQVPGDCERLVANLPDFPTLTAGRTVT
jgi:hypothetical protein